MSSPIDRSSDMDGISRYAPKWARDLESARRQHQVLAPLQTAGGAKLVSVVPADRPEAEHVASLAPSMMPEPPIRERPRSLLRGGGSMNAFFPFILAIFLAALIAFIIVVEWPKLWGFVAKPRSNDSSFATRFDGDPSSPPARPWARESEPGSAEAAPSDSAPSTADPWNAAINPAATAPIVSPPPVMPTPPMVATPTSA